MPFWTFQFSYQLWGMCSTNSSGIFGLDGIPGWGKKEVFPELCTSHCNVEEKWPTVQIFDLAQTMSKDVLHYSYFTSSLRIAITDKRCNNTGRSKIRILFIMLTGTYWFCRVDFCKMYFTTSIYHFSWKTVDILHQKLVSIRRTRKVWKDVKSRIVSYVTEWMM